MIQASICTIYMGVWSEASLSVYASTCPTSLGQATQKHHKEADRANTARGIRRPRYRKNAEPSTRTLIPSSPMSSASRSFSAMSLPASPASRTRRPLISCPFT